MANRLRHLSLVAFVGLAAFLVLALLQQGSRPAEAAFTDADGDGAIDLAEEISGSDPFDAASIPEDTGADGLLGTARCADGVDNDLDGLADGDDTGCSDSDGDAISDAMEAFLGSDPSDPASFPEDSRLDVVLDFFGFGFLTFCADGIDNDRDGLADSDDPGCEPIDNDNDGFDDAAEKGFGSDPTDPNSVPEHEIPNPGSCSDGVDNDLDGGTDDADPGCVAPANDNFSVATNIAALPFTDGPIAMKHATIELGEPTPRCAFDGIANSIWYSFTPSEDTLLVADTMGSDFEHVLAVWTPQGIFGLAEIACDSGFGFPPESRFAFEATGGQTYFFQVGGFPFDTAAGNLTFNLDVGFPPANDDFADATIIASLPFTDSVETLIASTEPGERAASCTFGGDPVSTVWFAFTPTEDATLVADIIGSDFNTVLAVWIDTTFGLAEVACDSGFGFPPESRLAFEATGGQTYFFQVGGLPFFEDPAGNLTFNLDVGFPPANDDFPDATIITTLPFTGSVDTLIATTEPGEPTPSCTFGDPVSTVWYSFTPDDDAFLVADTAGSDFSGTFIAAYQGTSLVDLTQVACAALSFPATRLAFEATGGQTYFFQVGGVSFGPEFFGHESSQIDGWSSDSGILDEPGGPVTTGFPASSGNLVFNLDTRTVDCPASQFSVGDPLGDVIGFQPPSGLSTPNDIISVSGGSDAENFCLTVEFAGPVDPPDADTAQAVFAVIDFDTDENPDTGVTSEIDFSCPDPSGLGVEVEVSMFGGLLVPIFQFGEFSVIEAPGAEPLGHVVSGEFFAIALFEETSFTLVIPLAALGGDGSFNFALFVGGRFFGPTDCAPNGGFIHATGASMAGDVDCNGSVDAIDALFVLHSVAGLQPFADCINVADVNCDGAVDASDALMILRHVAGLSVSLPSGCPPIGLVPT